MFRRYLKSLPITFRCMSTRLTCKWRLLSTMLVRPRTWPPSDRRPNGCDRHSPIMPLLICTRKVRQFFPFAIQSATIRPKGIGKVCCIMDVLWRQRQDFTVQKHVELQCRTAPFVQNLSANQTGCFDFGERVRGGMTC